MKLFTILTYDGSGIEGLMLEHESVISKHELLSYIDQNKDITYNIEDKKIARYCYVCDTVINYDFSKFNGNMKFSYGTRPYCNQCAMLSSKERGNIIQKIKQKERAKKRQRLLILKEEKLVEEKRRKERKQREMLYKDKLYRAEQDLYRYEYFHEHGVYPKPSKSDNNIIYVWQYDNMYKIGITSKRRGTGRIYDVAKAGNMRANIVHYVEVDDARLVEKELLYYGDQVRFNYEFDGSTEFRYLSDENLIDIEYIIYSHAKQY